jgi:hypothetical protein
MMVNKTKIATYNARGLQSKHMWGRFLDAATTWSRRKRVSAMVVQEHNLQPDRDAELKRQCACMGITLTIGYAKPAPNGSHLGGVMLLTFDAEVKVLRVIESSGDLIRLTVEAHGRELDLAGVYVPSTPRERVDMILALRGRISDSTIVGGDWNCVPDVTLDVERDKGGPLDYANIGATGLADVMETLDLYDIRRSQLGLQKEPTRVGDNGAISTRLDRWYVPLNESVANILWSVKVSDDLVFKDCPSDHYIVTLEMEISQGERGHARKTIREDLIARPAIQNRIMTLVADAYKMGGSLEDKWTRSHNMMRHELIQLTEAERKRDLPKIRALRQQIEVHRKFTARNGNSPRNAKVREEMHR